MFAVKEPEHKIHPRDIKDKKGRHPLHLSDLKRLGKEYWLLMFVVGIFMLARVSETLIVLHAHKTFEFPKTYAPIIMTIYNLTYCLSSYPVGLLSDKIGRYGLLGVASAVLMLADFLLSFATNIYMVLIGALIWGIQMGMAQNLFVSLIADIVPEDLRGTGFGFYYLVGALASVLAGFGGGHIAEAYSVAHTFFASMVVAGLSLGVLFIFLKLTNKRGFSPAKS
jgi:MFS family permease